MYNVPNFGQYTVVGMDGPQMQIIDEGTSDLAGIAVTNLTKSVIAIVPKPFFIYLKE